MIHVIAVITAQPGERARILEAFRANRPAVLAETGCIEYVAVTDAQVDSPIQTPIGEDSFMVIEKWASMADLEAHARSPHMKQYAERTRAFVTRRAVHVLSAI